MTLDGGRDVTVTSDADEGFEELYDAAPCGYLSTDANGIITRVNGTFLRWTGFSAPELVSTKRFSDLLTAGGRIYFETHISPMLRMQRAIREIAVEVRRADGSILPALINSNVRTGPDGSVVGVRTIVIDATERRGYEEELLRERQRAQRAEEGAWVLAQTLQESLIPPEPSQIPSMEVAAAYRPAGAGDVVGGDFYDVFETPRGDWMALVGDVSGKGVEAARLTAAARYTLRASAMRSSQPALVVPEVNAALLALGSDRFCTVVLARIAQTGGTFAVTIGAAGHPLPLKIAQDGSVSAVGAPGSILGILEDVSVDEVTTDLRSGESLILFSDGATEARSPEGSFLEEEGFERLVRAAADQKARELCDTLTRGVVDFQAGSPRDDIVILVLRAS